MKARLMRMKLFNMKRVKNLIFIRDFFKSSLLAFAILEPANTDRVGLDFLKRQIY